MNKLGNKPKSKNTKAKSTRWFTSFMDYAKEGIEIVDNFNKV